MKAVRTVWIGLGFRKPCAELGSPAANSFGAAAPTPTALATARNSRRSILLAMARFYRKIQSDEDARYSEPQPVRSLLEDVRELSFEYNFCRIIPNSLMETNGHTPPAPTASGTWRLKVGLAEMLKGGVIMDVVTPEQAIIAENAGAVAVMALERVPADIRAHGGVARMSDPEMILGIKAAVTIPVMAKCRIGHFAEAEILEALEVDYIDESEVLTPADHDHHVWKHDFLVPFVCGARDLGEALRRCGEGAALIRTKGEAGTGDVVEAVRHMRTINSDMARVAASRPDELMAIAKQLEAPFELVAEVHRTGRLPVPNFSAGGIATPADAALMMKLGAEAVFVGSGIFKSGDPVRRAEAIVEAVAHYDNPKVVAEVSKGLGEPMVGINVSTLLESEQLATRGW